MWLNCTSDLVTECLIFQVKHPGLFYGREILTEATDEGREFLELERKLDSLFNSDQAPQIPYHATKVRHGHIATVTDEGRGFLELDRKLDSL